MSSIESGGIAPMQVKDQVYDRLRESLINQDFRPGEPLREASLTELYGVSKTPVREALVRLQQDGLVEIAAYRGARASTYSREYLRQIHEAREILECECVRRAARDRGPETAARLEETITQTRTALDAGDMHAAAQYLDHFDDVLFDLLPNEFIAEVRERLTAHLKRAGRQNISATSVEQSLTDHVTIAEAIRAGEVVAAEEALRAHLRTVAERQISDLASA